MNGNNVKAVFVLIAFFSGCLCCIPPNPDDGDGNVQCPSSLQECGDGCIPQNAVCCDNGAVNRYCLQPTSGCGGENCDYECPAGQVFCGMFCKNRGEQCCLGGCPSTTTLHNKPSTTTTQKKSGGVNVTLASTQNIVCTFVKTESLWSPDMPWDGSYVCRGSVTLDFHGLTFPENRRIILRMKDGSDDGEFSDYQARANTPLNKVTFTYSRIGGDYFQKSKPPCPAKKLSGVLQVSEAVPDIENPFPTQNLNINIPSSCN